MARLGDGHFAAIVEQLPGESVVWEGGPDRRGRWIPYARVGFVGLLVLTVVAWFVGLLLLLPTPSRSPAGQTADAAASARADTREEAEASPSSWSPLLVLLGSGLLVLAISNVVEARLASRNAWYVVTSERICIQSGVLGRNLTILDIDKVLSVKVSASWLERRYDLLSIEFLHAGTRATTSGRIAARGEVVMAFVPAQERLVTHAVNSWLPRDNIRVPRPRG
jgi:hypothetical protein